MLDQITPLILTYNEAPNIARVLERLDWAGEVVVLDSGSSDRTVEICESFANVRVETRAFDQHADQWNHGLTRCHIDSEWVLALDADYVLERELVDGLRRLSPQPGVEGYRAHFRYAVFGRPLSGSLYPPVTVLFRRACGAYVQDGHTQRLEIAGRIIDLDGHILHDDRKSLERWLESQARYAQLEAGHISGRRFSELGFSDKIRKTVILAPLLAPVYTLVVAKGALDGWYGLFYAFQRGIAEAMLSLALIQRKLGR